MNPHPEMTLHPNPTSPPGKAATEGLDSRCGLVGIEGPEKAAVRLFQRARAKPMDARLWSPTGTPFTTSAIKSFFEQEIYKHPTEWWGCFYMVAGEIFVRYTEEHFPLLLGREVRLFLLLPSIAPTEFQCVARFQLQTRERIQAQILP